MNEGCEDRRLVEVFQEHILWQALLSEVLNLWILLPGNNLVSGLFGWLVDGGILSNKQHFYLCMSRSNSYRS